MVVATDTSMMFIVSFYFSAPPTTGFYTLSLHDALPISLSPQYTRLGRLALRLAANTPNSTSLGTVPKAETTRAFGTFLANASAPEEVCAITRSVSSAFRSEEHTSELQSHSDLVCRLLLEKKKKQTEHHSPR